MTNLKQLLQSSTKRKKLLLALFSSFLLIVATVGIVVGVRSRRGGDNHRQLSPATHAIVKSSCLSTRFPDLCYSAIASAPSHVAEKISTKKDVIALSIKLTTSAVERNYFTVKKLIQTRPNLTRREKNALHDCLETIDDTLDELRGALQDLESYKNNNNNNNNNNNKTLKDYVDDIKTLISSAITNQLTCLDGFSHANADRHVRGELEKGQVHVEQMCSNSLAMFKNMSDPDVAIASHVSKRSLYDWPRWLSRDDRRMLAGAEEVKPDVVVAADGSGDYRTITEAVEAAPEKSMKRHVIKIKAGVYREYVEVHKKKINLMFVGDGRKNTIITGNKNVKDGWTTFDSPTVAITGEGFLARDITFENTAGPSKHQAVALRVGADKAAFYQCDFLAYQDTLYVHHNRQFFINCLIAGTVDFIFGNSAVVIQDSDIHARKPDPNQKNMVTAQSRSDPNQNTGIVIHKSRISAIHNDDLSGVQTYLGRPWKEYSRTVVMMTSIDNVIHPYGWHEWDGEFALNTLYYAEYGNSGRGSDTSMRRKWKGVKVIDEVEAQQFTPGEFIDGESWLKSTTFPYYLDL